MCVRSFVSSQDDFGIAVYASASRSVELKIDSLSSGVRTFTVDANGSYLALATPDGTIVIHKLLLEEDGPARRQYQAYDMVCVKHTAVGRELCLYISMEFSVCFQPAPPSRDPLLFLTPRRRCAGALSRSR